MTCGYAEAYFRFVTTVHLNNNIFWGESCNGVLRYGFAGLLPTWDHHVSRNCTQIPGFYNFPAGVHYGADPQFVGPDDFRLGAGSPYIDAGDSFALPLGFTLDLDRGVRIADDPNAPNVGIGNPFVVDLGAYER